MDSGDDSNEGSKNNIIKEIKIEKKIESRRFRNYYCQG